MGRALYALLLWAALHGGDIHSGYAPRYSPGVMERVARNRRLPQVGCMVSSPYWPIGTMIFVYGANTDHLELCRVTDVSADKDRARHLRTKRWAELGYQEARRFCGAQHMHDRPEQCPILVVKLGAP